MVHTERRVQQNNHTGLGYGGKSKLQSLTLLFKPQVKEKTLYNGTCTFATMVNGCFLETFRRTLKATHVQRCRMDSKTLRRNESRKSRYLFSFVISSRSKGGVLRGRHPLHFVKKNSKRSQRFANNTTRKIPE